MRLKDKLKQKTASLFFKKEAAPVIQETGRTVQEPEQEKVNLIWIVLGIAAVLIMWLLSSRIF